jgi:hypothetical protein
LYIDGPIGKIKTIETAEIIDNYKSIVDLDTGLEIELTSLNKEVDPYVHKPSIF